MDIENTRTGRPGNIKNEVQLTQAVSKVQRRVRELLQGLDLVLVDIKY